MEHIKKIEINNFKSIRHAEIKDCRRINVFIGYPNVGKSNILEALGLFSIEDPFTSFSSFIRMDNFPTIFFDGNIQDRLEVKLNDNQRFIGKIIDGSLKFERQYASDATLFEDIEFITPLNDSSITLKKRFKLKDNKTIIDFEGPNFTEMKFGHIIPDILKYEFKKDYTPNETVFTSLQHPNGNNIFSILYTNQVLKKQAADILNQYGLELLYDSRNQNFTILKRTNTGIFTVPYELLADTIQRLFFYKAAILSNQGVVLLFEEPEAHMFPPYISKLTSDMMFDKNNNQFFITTHSPYVLNDFMEELKDDELAVYLVSYKKETVETVIDKMSKEEMHEAYQFGYDFFLNMENFIPTN